VSEIVTDKAGNFKGGNVEDNKIEDTVEQRTIKDVANDIVKIVASLFPYLTSFRYNV
jgi:hypothetical protein